MRMVMATLTGAFWILVFLLGGFLIFTAPVAVVIGWVDIVKYIWTN